MVTVYGEIDHILPDLSLKAIFQKILFSCAQVGANSGLRNPADVPLRVCANLPGLTYRSAIAYKLKPAAQLSVEQWAHQLALKITAQAAEVPGQTSAPILLRLEEHWSIHVEPSGWIALRVTRQGVLSWLHQFNQIAVRLSHHPPSPAVPIALLPSTHFSLCQKLRVSLPVFLQVSHARCHAWLRHLGEPTMSLPKPLSSESLPTFEVIDDAPSQASDPYEALLKALVLVTDTMAAQIGDAQTYLRQAYSLAQAIYAFQATVPVATVYQLSTDNQIILGGLMQASQQILALVLIGVLGQTPTNNLS